MKTADPSQRLKQIIELQSALIALKFDLLGFMNEVVGRLQQLTSATGAIVELVEDDMMSYAAVSGSAEQFLGYKINRTNSLSGLCVATGEMLYCRDVNYDPRVNIEACKEVGVLSMIVVPLIRLGETVGVLKVISGEPHAFDEEDTETLQLTAGLLGAALGQQIEIQERGKIEAKLTHIAHTDPLTGLPNRSLFHDRLQQALHRLGRTEKSIALMYIDIDHFKAVNDTYGHLVGDALLQEFTLRAKKILRPSDTLARLGGDEFALIAENLHGRNDAKIIAAKLINAMQSEFKVEHQSLKTNISVGVVVTADGSLDAKLFIGKADAALYEAKRRGRNRFYVGMDATSEVA